MDWITFFNCLPWLLLFAVYFLILAFALKLKIAEWWFDTEKARRERAEKKQKEKELKARRRFWKGV